MNIRVDVFFLKQVCLIFLMLLFYIADDDIFNDLNQQRTNDRETTPEYFNKVDPSGEMSLFSPSSKPKEPVSMIVVWIAFLCTFIMFLIVWKCLKWFVNYSCVGITCCIIIMTYYI